MTNAPAKYLDRTPAGYLSLAVAGAALLFIAFSAANRIGAGAINDFHEFYQAAVAAARGQDMYAVGKLGYLYPPLLAVLLRPLTWMGEQQAAYVWLAMNVVLTGVSAWLLTGELVRRSGLTLSRGRVMLAGTLGLLLVIDRLRSEFRQGESDVLMLLSFTLGLVWLDRRPLLAGLALAFGANLKYLTLAMLPYLLVRRRWKAAGSLVVSCGLWALVPALIIGWKANAQALATAFSGLLRLVSPEHAGETSARVMPISGDLSLSITSFAARTLGAGELTAGAAGLVAAVFGVLVVFALVLYARQGVPMFARTPELDTRRPLAAVVGLEWIGLIALVLLFGPQTNPRHLTLLLPATIALSILIVGPGSGRSRLWAVAAAVIGFAACSLPPGGERFEAEVRQWRNVAGPGWGLLVMHLILLVVGIRAWGPKRGTDASGANGGGTQ